MSGNCLNPFYDVIDANKSVGFSASYTGMDHSFVLHALTEIGEKSEKKVICSFIGFSKAFDFVCRAIQW